MLKVTVISIWFLILASCQSYDDYYDWTDGIETGDDLRILLKEINDQIIVTLWLNDIYGKDEQNKINERVKGTVKNMIEKWHPHSVYAEADVSIYNYNAYTFEELAYQLHIDLDLLQRGPMVMPMYDNHGEVFWGTETTDVLTLVKSVNNYLSTIEYEEWGDSPSKCDIEEMLGEVNDHTVHDPWNPYDYFTPSTPDKKHEQRQEREKKNKVVLKEPEKANA